MQRDRATKNLWRSKMQQCILALKKAAKLSTPLYSVSWLVLKLVFKKRLINRKIDTAPHLYTFEQVPTTRWNVVNAGNQKAHDFLQIDSSCECLYFRVNFIASSNLQSSFNWNSQYLLLKSDTFSEVRNFIQSPFFNQSLILEWTNLES